MASGIQANRKSMRAPVIPEKIQGLVTLVATEQQTPFLLWDISETGLGLWSATSLPPGAAIRLTFGQPYPLVLDAFVQWCHPEQDGDGFRCGIECSSSDATFSKLYSKFKSDMEKKASKNS